MLSLYYNLISDLIFSGNFYFIINALYYFLITYSLGMRAISLSCGLIVLINEIILLVWILMSLLNWFTIFLKDLCCKYVKISWLNSICRHSSVACERNNVSNYSTCYFEHYCWATWVTVKLKIKKVIRLCPGIALNIIFVCCTFCVFQSP